MPRESAQVRVLYLSPIGDVYDVLFKVIRELIKDDDFDGWHADAWWKLPKTGPAVEVVERAIETSDIVVAEVTEGNPSVMYEVGVASALHRPTILLSTNPESSPFDIRHLQHVSYSRESDAIQREDRADLKNELKGHLLAVSAARPISGTVVGAPAELTERVALEDLQDGEPVFLQSRGKLEGRVEILETDGDTPIRALIRFSDGYAVQIRAETPHPIEQAILRRLPWTGGEA